jgi:hypothetical protein
MPIRSSQPDIPVKVTAEKNAKKLDREHTRALFRSVLVGILFGHFVLTLLVVRRGVIGYLEVWANILAYMLAQPATVLLLAAALAGLYYGLDLWKHPDPDQLVLPEYPEVEDLRFQNSLHIGSGWTRGGKQPGDLYEPGEDDELMEEPHLIVREKGLFGNMSVTGGVGSGKTSTFIYPVLTQAIEKFPRPPHPDDFTLGPDGRYPEAPAEASGTIKGVLSRMASAAAPVLTAETGRAWIPYAGMTREEALAEHDRLWKEHREKKWGIFLIDAKGDITEMVQRMAALAGREDDVIVLRPPGEHTYNPLLVNADPLVQSEMVLDGIEAVQGSGIQSYWRGVMGEWLANALALLRIVDPTRITFRSILRMARNETLRSSMVSEAQAIMRQAQEDEERLRRLGKEYQGVKVDPSVVDFWRDWDDDEASGQQKRDVVSSVKSQSKYFVTDNMAPFLCPELPPTFPGFDEMIDRGMIVCLQMPLAEYEKVAKVLGILMLADAQQAARARINRPWINQERVLLYAVDEISAYLNPITRDFLAMARQSRVCFVAAHQSQGQLIRGNDRSFEQGFNDNLRSRFAFNAPNAEAAKRQTFLYGARNVIKESWSESQAFAQVQHEAGTETLKPKGGESQGAVVRYDEVERNWFDADDFMTLRTGECIAMQFDGETTLAPRKINCPAWYKSLRFQDAMKMEIPPLNRRPHPVLRVTGTESSRDKEYITSALRQTGYCMIEPLADLAGDLAGFKFITDVGTLIVGCDVLEAHRDELSDALTEPQILVAFTDLRVCAQFFGGVLGFVFERVVGLTGVYRRLFPSARATTWHQIMSAEASGLSYEVRGSYEYHVEALDAIRLRNQKALLEDSRRCVDVFLKLGDALHGLGDTALEDLYETTRERIAGILDGSDPGEDPPPHSEDAEVPTEEMGSGEAPEPYLAEAQSTRPSQAWSLRDLSDDMETSDDYEPAHPAPFGTTTHDPVEQSTLSAPEDDTPARPDEPAPEASQDPPAPVPAGTGGGGKPRSAGRARRPDPSEQSLDLRLPDDGPRSPDRRATRARPEDDTLDLFQGAPLD